MIENLVDQFWNIFEMHPKKVISFFAIDLIAIVGLGIYHFENEKEKTIQEYATEISWKADGINYSCKLERLYENHSGPSLQIIVNWKMEDVLSRSEFGTEGCCEEQEIILSNLLNMSHKTRGSFEIYSRNGEEFLLERLTTFDNPYRECAKRIIGVGNGK